MKPTVKTISKFAIAFILAAGFIFLFKGAYDMFTGDWTPFQMFMTGFGIILFGIIFGFTKLSEIPKWLVGKLK